MIRNLLCLLLGGLLRKMNGLEGFCTYHRNRGRLLNRKICSFVALSLLSLGSRSSVSTTLCMPRNKNFCNLKGINDVSPL